jgi:hypothetical protein
MKREIYYIVYNTQTLLIHNTHRWMGKDILKELRENNSLKCINVTHPKTKELLSKINEANNTDYN